MTPKRNQAMIMSDGSIDKMDEGPSSEQQDLLDKFLDEKGLGVEDVPNGDDCEFWTEYDEFCLEFCNTQLGSFLNDPANASPDDFRKAKKEYEESFLY